MKRYTAIARALGSMMRCQANNNSEWEERHSSALSILCENLPSGSGFDSGSSIDFDASTPEKLVFNTSFHHMNEGGFYDGWTSHQVTVTPSLEFGFRTKITGPNRNDIKELISDEFDAFLRADIEEWAHYTKPSVNPV